MKSDDIPGTMVLPKPYLWVCGACGRTAQSRYGVDNGNKRTSAGNWDESCMQNAILVVPNDGEFKYLTVEEIPDECLSAQ